MGLVHYLILATFVVSTLANVAVTRRCRGEPRDACQVTEVRIDPCEAPKRCTFTKGTNVSLSFDFTPNFAATKLKTQVYGDIAGVGWTAFADQGSSDGCSYSKCPTEVGQSQVFDYNLYIGRKISRGDFTIKWKVWNEENENEVCCFTTNIKITN